MSTGGEEKERKLAFLRALEIANRDDRAAPDSSERIAQDTAAILARVRRTMAEREPARPATVLAVPPRRRVDRLPVAALAILTLGVAVFPHQGVLAVLLFAVVPLALLVKWTFEAYAGPELERECAVLDERSRAFALLRRRLDGVADIVAEARVDARREIPTGGEHLDEVVTRLRSAGATLEVLADLVDRTSSASRAFATNWLAAPVESFSAYRHESADIAPDRVRATVAAALAQLRGLASMDVAVPIPGAADASPPARTVGAEIELIVHALARSQTTLDRELTRLERAFDTVHQSAAVHVIRTRIPDRLVRAAALIGMNLNVSTLSRARRTPARAVFVQEARMAPDTSLRNIHRAAVAMRTAV